ncbi:diphthine--ammonia ligase isoform X2 [Scyliorhinus canicula]|uniref:diphthine--ammonia ligase isoform X2 n=1 Tax=Scyliorhinus canicula TaxID=7830 RepID=UPI0018F7915E|nr:diphthine--ammonia ligase isoform X2 [Scyliorhinus canicula]
MKVVALISGGKDSCYNMMQCVAAGHEVVALANLRPTNHKDELDSYMYQTVGHEAIDLYSEAIGLPLYRRTIQGSSLAIGRDYTKCEGDEVEDLYHLLKLIKEKRGVEGVSVGAILSDYQRVRVENVCRRLNLQPLAYLWRRNQEDLLREIILSNVQAMIIKVAAFGLDPKKHLGKTLDQIEPYLKQVSQKYGVHVCGEGGEYETFTLDCPLFRKRIVVDSSEVVVHSADAFAPVGYLKLLNLHLEDKPNPLSSSMALTEIKPCLSCCNQEISVESEDCREMSKPQITWNLTSSSSSEEKLNYWSAKTKKGYQWISGTCFPMEGKSIKDATKQIFSLLQAELAVKEYKLSDVILLYLYLKDMSDFGIINSIYESYFNLSPPARVCVEAPLPDGVPLQIDCLVHKYELTLPDTIKQQKEVMHVQSISHWAPANIGPYSQSVKVGDEIFCAGQIGLIPCTMQLSIGGVKSEAALSLSHVQKILEAVKSETNLSNILLANCYVTDKKYISVVQNLWQKSLREHSQENEDAEAVSGLLVVVVFPHLPKDAAVEWHVIALTDDPSERKYFIINKKFQCYVIDCEVVVSSSLSSAAISLAVSLLSPSANSLDLKDILQELAVVFQQAVDRLPQDVNKLPLCFKTFFCENTIDASFVRRDLERSLDNLLGSNVPLLILVPAADLPGLEILHVACWLSS